MTVENDERIPALLRAETQPASDSGRQEAAAKIEAQRELDVLRALVELNERLLVLALDKVDDLRAEIGRLYAPAGEDLMKRSRGIAQTVTERMLSHFTDPIDDAAMVWTRRDYAELVISEAVATFAVTIGREGREAAIAELAQIPGDEAKRIRQVDNLSEAGWGAVAEAEKIERDILARAGVNNCRTAWRSDRDDIGAQPQPGWRHKTRGTTYVEIGRGELQKSGDYVLKEGDRLVTYRGEDGRLWHRYEPEFDDGRFEPIGGPDATRSGR